MRSALGAVALSLSLAACGGGDGGPTPLSNHFQQTYIAQIDVDQQGEVVAANSAWDVAKREQMKADADLREAKNTLDIAKNEAKAAKLDEDSARKNYEAAKASADQNRLKEAEKAQQAAQLSRNAADERVKYYQGYSEWLKQLVRYTTENAYYREAQYELAMSRLAQKNSIAPPGFNADKFVQQESSRAKRADQARGRASDAKGKATDARKRWLAIQGEADKVLGKKSEFPDPMSDKPAGTDPAAGAGGTTIGGSSPDGAAPDGDDPTAPPAPVEDQ
ncbi:MAG: hypothetical protein IPL61_03475 [Myxococcales bacterium]|nr:hypothetical protein [Myxococcales bacterium]